MEYFIIHQKQKQNTPSSAASDVALAGLCKPFMSQGILPGASQPDPAFLIGAPFQLHIRQWAE